MGIFAFVCFTALVFFGFHKVFHKPTEEPKDDDELYLKVVRTPLIKHL